MTTRPWPLDTPAETLARLHTDHQRVRDLFQHYEHSRDPQLRRQIASQVCVALELQALLEDRASPPQEPTRLGRRMTRWARTPVWPTSTSSR